MDNKRQKLALKLCGVGIGKTFVEIDDSLVALYDPSETPHLHKTANIQKWQEMDSDGFIIRWGFILTT